MKIIIADDHGIFRHSLSFLINSNTEYEVVADIGSTEKLSALVRQHSPQLLIIDYHMPCGSSLATAEYIKRRDNTIKIIFLTGTQSGVALKHIAQSQVDGVVHKEESAADMIAAIKKVVAGEKIISKTIQERIDSVAFDLTQREFEVLCLVMQGKSSVDMAQAMNIAPRTIDKHKENILKKTGAANVLQLVEMGHKMRLLEVD